MFILEKLHYLPLPFTRMYPTLFKTVKPSPCFRCSLSPALVNGHGNEGNLLFLFLTSPYWTIKANSDRMGNQCISVYGPTLCFLLSFPVVLYSYSCSYTSDSSRPMFLRCILRKPGCISKCTFVFSVWRVRGIGLQAVCDLVWRSCGQMDHLL